MRTWAPLWSVIVESSLWDEPDFVVKVFLTMLAKKDFQHIYRGNAFNLHKQSRKSEAEVLEAWKVLSSPDTLRLEKQPYEGRRIEAVEGGWLILNGEKYRELVQLEMKRLRDARAQDAFRKRQKLGIKPKPRVYRKAPAPLCPRCQCDSSQCTCRGES